jgi:N-terminal domain of toast_rack, DUF2154
MNKEPLSKRLVFAAFALWFGLIGCGLFNTTTINDLKTESQTVDLDSATSARVQVEFQVGDLKIENGANSLMEASFRYNMDNLQPQVKYSENGEQGELVISQQALERIPLGGQLVNEWSIQLANDIPIDLSILTGAGNADLSLDALDLTNLDIQTGAGVTNVNLDGSWTHDLAVSIMGGVGELTVTLPAEMGVRVDMETALVSVSANGLIKEENGYINKAFGTAPYTLTLTLQAGVGSVVLVSP